MSLIKNTRPGETGIIEFQFSGGETIQAFRLGSICEVKSPETIADESSKAAKQDEEFNKAIENMGKIMDVGSKIFGVTKEATKTLNELEKEK